MAVSKKQRVQPLSEYAGCFGLMISCQNNINLIGYFRFNYILNRYSVFKTLAYQIFNMKDTFIFY